MKYLAYILSISVIFTIFYALFKVVILNKKILDSDPADKPCMLLRRKINESQ